MFKERSRTEFLMTLWFVSLWQVAITVKIQMCNSNKQSVAIVSLIPQVSPVWDVFSSQFSRKLRAERKEWYIAAQRAKKMEK